MFRAGARVKIMRSIHIGNFQPKQNQIHDEHIRKELQSQPIAYSSTRQTSSASASTHDISGAAEQRLPHRMHAPTHGACFLRALSDIVEKLADSSQFACLDKSAHLKKYRALFQRPCIGKKKQCCLGCLRVDVCNLRSGQSPAK